MKKKGFVRDEDIPKDQNPRKGNPHPYIYFTYPDGKVCFHIRTFYSEKGYKTDLNKDDISSMSRELYFSSKGEFIRYIECSKKYEEYYSELVAQRKI